jgi:16S rRNA A1518/A1519 N6-dimethyltransferase RsmA/KsgA/DIM1 with predicted DNA glycosylase/AP lyase activity
MSRQKLGQHFLHSPAWCERIARTLPADPNATWLEIGPGHGEMTEFLAQRSRRVIAIETDPALAAGLRERAAAEWPTVEIVEADILSVNLAALLDPRQQHAPHGDTFVGRGVNRDINAARLSGVLASEPALDIRERATLRQGTASAVPTPVATRGPLGPEVSRNVRVPEGQTSGERFRVYGNLPYYITSPILSHLFRFAAQIDSIQIVIQWEVAARIAATPGHREYAYLSALCQYFTRPEIVLRIPPGAFRPPPKVNSALLAMNLPGEGPHLQIANDGAFLKFLQNCFSQKRKTLRNNLKELFSDEQIAAALATCQLTPKSRAEELSLSQFSQLYRSLTPPS